MWLEVGYYRGHRAFIVHGYSEHFALVRETRITTSAVAAANSATKGAWAWKRANRGSWRFLHSFTRAWKRGEKVERAARLRFRMLFPVMAFVADSAPAAVYADFYAPALGRPYEPRPG